MIVTDAGRLEVGRPSWHLGEDALADSRVTAYVDNSPVRRPALLGLGEAADRVSSSLSLSGVGVPLGSGRGNRVSFGYKTSATAFNRATSDEFVLNSPSGNIAWEEDVHNEAAIGLTMTPRSSLNVESFPTLTSDTIELGLFKPMLPPPSSGV